MKKVVVASLLVVAGMVCVARTVAAQTQVNLGSQQPAGGGVQMSPAEYNAYNSAITQTDPKAKAAALEAYLTAYPQSAVKAAVLEQLMLAYSAFDPAKTLDAADRLLQVDPNNLRALTFETYFRLTGADSITDPAAKQAALDKAADYAQKGLAATKPAEMSATDFATLQSQAKPVFYRAIATAALNKKDAATAVTNFKLALHSVPEPDTTKPGPLLQDTFSLAQAYYQMTPPDYVNCTWYASRAAAFAPEPYKSQMLPLAKYCYKKYHGSDDGYDAVLAAAQKSLDPPADFTIKPAPKPEDMAHDLVASTPEADLPKLAISDREFVLANGKPEDAEKVWNTMKGKSVTIPDALVIESSPTVLKVAVSDDAVQSKTPDFTFNMKAPEEKLPPAAAKKLADEIAAATAVGQKVTLSGTFDSYTPKPLMIIMSDGSVVLPKKAPAKAPVHRTAPRK
ncbi:MAG: putative lipoprotein [Edaphobacter sp.]|nr:putative lipoprotein [Edaphobacter sp.]